MIDFSEIFQSLQSRAETIPQTQRDISYLAQTAKQARSPEVQQMVGEIREELQTFANVQLALQALSTVAIVGMFLINLKNHSRGL